ncbi:MAG: YggU family protein [Aridibacter famidurans]|nr:YggU family protein [Aridibacter famidurans]
MIEFDEQKGTLEFRVLVVPKASKTEIRGEHDGRLRVRVAAPPVEGAANAELIAFFAKLLKVPKSSIEIASGETSRRKSIRLNGVDRKDAAEIKARLAQ